jgi:hypothetical protein
MRLILLKFLVTVLEGGNLIAAAVTLLVDFYFDHEGTRPRV